MLSRVPSAVSAWFLRFGKFSGQRGRGRYFVIDNYEVVRGKPISEIF